MTSGSPIVRPTVKRGLSDEKGSWKTICTRRLNWCRPPAAEARHVLILEEDCAGRRLHQVQHAAAGRGLAAAALADQREGFSFSDRETHVIDGADGAEMLHETADFQKRGHGSVSRARQHRTRRPGSTSRSSCGRWHGSTAWGQRGANRQPGGRLGQVGHRSFEGMQAPFARGAVVRHSAGDRPKQAARVRMQRPGEQAFHIRIFHNLAGVHDGYVMGHFRDNAEVVGDEENGQPAVGLQFQQQVDDLGLEADVEGGGRLIGDEQGGPAGDGMAMVTRWRRPPLS